MTGSVVIILFLVLTIIGLPISASMALPSILYVIINNVPLSVVAQKMMNSLNSFPLLAVPTFILAGTLMNRAGISKNIFDFSNIIVGKFRGGLSYVNILTSLIFAGMSGAALAEIGALGNIQLKAMKEQGYKIEDAAAITAASATLGPIFPPSIPLIMYATIAEVSGVKCLIAGVFPALLITLLLMVMATILAYKNKWPKFEQKLTIKEKLKITWKAFPAVMAPVLLIGGLVTGMFSATELAAVTVVYALILGFFVYKELKISDFKKMGIETVKSTASIMFIVAAASIFAFVLTIEQIPNQMTNLMLSISKNPIVLLLIVNLLLFVVGMLMETIAALLVLTPLLVPALTSVGVDPVHLGVVIVLNLMIGLLTPPVSMSLYMISNIAEKSPQVILKSLMPYFIPLVISLFIVTFFPILSTWLPDLVFKR